MLADGVDGIIGRVGAALRDQAELHKTMNALTFDPATDEFSLGSCQFHRPAHARCW